MKLAERMSRLMIESAFDVLQRARALEAQGRDIIHLEIGEPDFDTPQHIKDAAVEAIGKGFTKYTAVGGTPSLKQAIIAINAEAKFGFPNVPIITL